jgi:hypothetical protein
VHASLFISRLLPVFEIFDDEKTALTQMFGGAKV